jgi:hypothetical protein
MSFKTIPLILGTLLLAAPALAAVTTRHSGSIVSESANHAGVTITIAEMGAWHGPTTRPAHRTFHLTPATKVELVARGNGSGHYENGFVERPLEARDLRPGDYATVTVEREAGKPVVTMVEVVRLAGTSERAAAHTSK